MKRKIFSVLFAVVLVLSLSLVTAVPVQAATINVPADYATIQAAVNAANPGDTIIVAAGTYSGTGGKKLLQNDVVLIDKDNLTLNGANAGVSPITGTRGDESIIDAAGLLEAVGVSANNVTIDGFTIKGDDTF